MPFCACTGNPDRSRTARLYKYIHALLCISGTILYGTCSVRSQLDLYFIVYKNIENVSCEYDGWVVETQLCKLRDTSDTLVGRACAMFYL